MPAKNSMTIVGLRAMTARSLSYSPRMLKMTSDLYINSAEFITQRDGMRRHDPYLVACDQMLLYAERHLVDHGHPLEKDPNIGPYFVAAVMALCGLINGPGTFDRRTCLEILNTALTTGGFTDSLLLPS